MTKDDSSVEAAILAESSIKNSENLIDEDEVLDCIEETLNSIGRTIAYTIYLNWSAVDREKQLGILGDPQSFCDSLYSIFGDDNARKIENLLATRLRNRFPSVRIDGLLDSDTGCKFVSIMTSLKHDTISSSV